MHILHLTQLPYFFSFFFLKVLKVVAAPSEFFFPQFCVQPHHSPGAGAERLRGRGPMESRLVRSAGSRGPAGGVMGSVIVPAVWIGLGGWKDGVRSPGKKGGEGTPQLPVLPLTPLSLCLSADRPTVWEAGPHFPQADAHPPPLFEIAFAAFPELHKLNCNNLPPLMRFSFYLSLSKKFEFSASKKRKKKKENQSFFFLMCVYVWSRILVRRY